jgi:Zn-dependent peptidase ImmA (M78 family)
VNQEVIAALLSWAIQLGGFAKPDHLPAVVYKPHVWLVAEACNNRPCNVLAWYRNEGVIYVDERLMDNETSFVASLIVHELVHFLQDQTGQYSSQSCNDTIARQREAYAVQNAYLAAVGNPAQVFPPAATC